MIAPGQLIILVSPKGKRFLRIYGKDEELHTGDGVLKLEDAAAAGYGGVAHSHLGAAFRVVRPTLHDLVKGVKRQTQILYPKEIGYVLVRLGVGPGTRVVEAGSGSGSLTMALAYMVGEEGGVYSCERREEFHKLAKRNVAKAGLDHRVEFMHRDVATEGFGVTDADCLFLDVREPWTCLEAAAEALAPGAPLGFLLPTTNQVQDLLAALEQAPFADVEVLEIMLRRYKPVAERLRPADRMVAHTGFLVFARQQDRAGEVNLDENPSMDQGLSRFD
jgi:tRNA (adenine57-N1/adenine58-N1)-methyltransferase